jgi:hypothetical protein
MKNLTIALVSTLSICSWISPTLAQEDPLDFLDGLWVSVSPPGPHIVFTKGSLGTREASLPTLGQASIRVSQGEQGSNMRVSGPGFDCYYYVTPLESRNKMVWESKGGSSVCVATALFEKINDTPGSSTSLQTPSVAPSAHPQMTECQQIWVQRNSIFRAHKYCFKTPRAISYFGNAGCIYANQNDVLLSDGERARLVQLVNRERSLSCAADPGQIVPQQAPR